MHITLAMAAFGGAVVLLARCVSIATAMVNAELVSLPGLALVLQSTFENAALAYVALARR